MVEKMSLYGLVVFIACALLPAESRATMLVPFDDEAVGNYTNPFISVDSPLVEFSEAGSGAAGEIGIINHSGSLVVSSGVGPGAPDYILMEFLTPVTSLSFDIGHPSGLTDVDGWLQVYDGATLVSEARVALDADTLFNQVISYSGSPITSAQYAIVATGSSDLGAFAESLDNVHFKPIPEPATATLGLLALGGLLMRRRRAA